MRELVLTTSWDDGHPLDMRIAELLAKYGLTGTFYVPRVTDRTVMSVEQIRELSGRFEIGAHTLNHKCLDQLTVSEAKEQLSGSRKWIEEVTGEECRLFCFPGGKYRKRQLPLVHEAGFRAARTVELLSTEFPQGYDDLLLIPTTIQVCPHGFAAYAKNALRRLTVTNFMKSHALFYAGDWAAIARRLFSRSLDRGGVFHLWGHSWEIEQEKQWGQLEKFLAMLGANLEKLQCVTNGELSKYEA